MAGMGRDEDVGGPHIPRAKPLVGPSDIHNLPFQAVMADRVSDEMLEIAVADQQEADLGRAAADFRNGSCQHVDTMPATEGPDEGDDPVLGREAESGP